MIHASFSRYNHKFGCYYYSSVSGVQSTRHSVIITINLGVIIIVQFLVYKPNVVWMMPMMMSMITHTFNPLPGVNGAE